MNVKTAATKTWTLISDRLMNSPTCDEVSDRHLLEMVNAIEDGVVEGEQAHRWLGWIQGAACARGGGTLEEMKGINKAA